MRLVWAAALCALLAPAAFGAEGAYLGVILGTVDDAGMKKLDYDGRGAYVMEVVKDSPAEQAGMKDSDIIVAFGQDTIIGPGHLRDLLALRSPGDNLSITVWRRGANETLHVTLGTSEAKGFLSLDPGDMAKTIILSGEPRAWLGVKVQELSEQLGERFGAKEGVLISEVIKDSPAARVGLLAGDVITGVGDETVKQPFELTKVLGDQQPGEKVAVVFIRDGQPLTKAVELGETPEKYRKSLPQILSWADEGQERRLQVLPEGSEIEWQSRDRDLRKQMEEMREALSEQMKALRSELEALKQELQRGK